MPVSRTENTTGICSLQMKDPTQTSTGLQADCVAEMELKALQTADEDGPEVRKPAQTCESLVCQIAELTRSNAELDQFASIIAHDLRSPLFSLSGCAQLLADEDERLSESGREAVRYILETVRHMNRLITKLLQRSRVGKSQLKRTNCRLEQVLVDVTGSLRAIMEKTGAQVTHDPLPMIQADPVLIHELLQNLIENAIKYRSGDPPRIHLSARKGAGEWILSVRDNGIGIDPGNLERIFQPFQRLREEGPNYTGLGVGLAICKQILERHGGRIWAESRPGQGSTFFFCLPDKPEHGGLTRISGCRQTFSEK